MRLTIIEGNKKVGTPHSQVGHRKRENKMEDTPSSTSCVRGDDERKSERRSIKAKETV